MCSTRLKGSPIMDDAAHTAFLSEVLRILKSSYDHHLQAGWEVHLNGVTDPTGTMDEGACRYSDMLDEVEWAMRELESMIKNKTDCPNVSGSNHE